MTSSQPQQTGRDPNTEYHDGGETPLCVACAWCCGCAVHPIAKPWGWNHEAWSRHRAVAHAEKETR